MMSENYNREEAEGPPEPSTSEKQEAWNQGRLAFLNRRSPGVPSNPYEDAHWELRDSWTDGYQTESDKGVRD